MSIKSLFLFITFLICLSNELSCSSVKVSSYSSLNKMYGECGKCYSYYKLLSSQTEVSYTVDCPNDRFILYNNISCKGGVDTYVSYQNDYNDYCSSTRCCLIKRSNDGGKTYLLYYSNNCTNSCFADENESSYFRFLNSTFLSYHETNDCVDSKPQYTSQLVCDQTKNYPIAATTTNSFTFSQSNSVSQSHSQQQKSTSKKEFEVISFEGVLFNLALFVFLIP